MAGMDVAQWSFRFQPKCHHHKKKRKKKGGVLLHQHFELPNCHPESSNTPRHCTIVRPELDRECTVSLVCRLGSWEAKLWEKTFSRNQNLRKERRQNMPGHRRYWCTLDQPMWDLPSLLQSYQSASPETQNP